MFRAPWIGLALAGETLLVGWQGQHGDFSRAGEAWKFVCLGGVAGLVYWGAIFLFARTGLSARKSVWLLWLGAAALRLAMLPAAPGDDFWRYRWEGKIQLHGFNPYQLSPDAPALVELRDVDWAKINHREYPAIYPPAVEWIFAGLARVGNSTISYKLLFTLADLGVVAVLVSLLARRFGSAKACAAAAWYAWNPLAVYVSAGGGHFDSLMVLALMGAVWALERNESICSRGAPSPRSVPVGLPDAATERRGYKSEIISDRSSASLAWMSVGLLGLAIALKMVPAVVLPVWAFALGWRRALMMLPAAAAMLPLSILFYGDAAAIFATLRKFAYVTRLNDPFWWLSEATLWANPTQKNGAYQLVSVLVCLASAVWFRHDWQRGLLWVLGTTLLLSPVLHPWYLIWILPVAAWHRQSAHVWFVFSVSLFGYFLLWDFNRTDAPWQQPVWLRLLIELPPLAALLWTAKAGGRWTVSRGQ